MILPESANPELWVGFSFYFALCECKLSLKTSSFVLNNFISAVKPKAAHYFIGTRPNRSAIASIVAGVMQKHPSPPHVITMLMRLEASRDIQGPFEIPANCRPMQTWIGVFALFI